MAARASPSAPARSGAGGVFSLWRPAWWRFSRLLFWSIAAPRRATLSRRNRSATLPPGNMTRKTTAIGTPLMATGTPARRPRARMQPCLLPRQRRGRMTQTTTVTGIPLTVIGTPDRPQRKANEQSQSLLSQDDRRNRRQQARHRHSHEPRQHDLGHLAPPHLRAVITQTRPDDRACSHVSG